MLKNFSIKNKIVSLVLVVCILTLGIGFAIIGMNYISRIRDEAVHNTLLYAKMVGEYCVMPLEFNYPDRAAEVLVKLENIPTILDGQVYDKSDKLFAFYARDGAASPRVIIANGSESLIDGDYIHISTPIMYKGSPYGTIYIRALTDISAKVRNILIILLALLFGLVILSYFLVSKLQRIISDPILFLAKLTSEISMKSDYSLRVGKGNDDEIGILYDEFNLMLDIIQKRQRERDRAEQSLRDSEVRYRRLTENAQDAIFRVSIPDGNFVYMSPAVFEITGSKPLSFYQSRFMPYRLIHPEWRRWLLNTWKMMKDGQLEKSFEYKIVDKMGQHRWIYQRNVLLKDENGRAIAFEAIATDISDRKIAEQEVKVLNQELEKRVKIRTSELESANNELKDFAYVVSHDLKAPLRGISQVAQWFVQDYTDVLDEDGQELNRLLISRVDRLNNLTDAILEYSRVGKIVSNSEKIDLNNLLEDVLGMLILPESMSININSDLPVIKADRIRMEQVFYNIISNSIKYMDKEKGFISLGFKNNGAFYEFTIKDNGCGIDKKYHEKVFKIFQSLDVREKNRDTGIGLALVRKIIELYGGQIWLESEPKIGTTISFTLKKTKVNI